LKTRALAFNDLRQKHGEKKSKMPSNHEISVRPVEMEQHHLHEEDPFRPPQENLADGGRFCYTTSMNRSFLFLMP
jgi:hypothetical protein